MRITCCLIFITIFGFREVCSANDNYRSIKDSIDQLIEQVKSQISEPVAIPDLNVDIPKNKLISGYVNTSNCKLYGIKTFELPFTYLWDTMPLNFTFKLNAGLNTDYNIEARLFNSPFLTIFGKGNASFIVNLTVEADTSINFSSLKIKNVKFILQNFKAIFNGLLDDKTFDKDFSTFLTDTVTSVANDYQSDISTTIQTLVNDVIASILNKTSAGLENKMGKGSSEDATAEVVGIVLMNMITNIEDEYQSDMPSFIEMIANNFVDGFMDKTISGIDKNESKRKLRVIMAHFLENVIESINISDMEI